MSWCACWRWRSACECSAPTSINSPAGQAVDAADAVAPGVHWASSTPFTHARFRFARVPLDRGARADRTSRAPSRARRVPFPHRADERARPSYALARGGGPVRARSALRPGRLGWISATCWCRSPRPSSTGSSVRSPSCATSPPPADAAPAQARLRRGDRVLALHRAGHELLPERHQGAGEPRAQMRGYQSVLDLTMAQSHMKGRHARRAVDVGARASADVPRLHAQKGADDGA